MPRSISLRVPSCALLAALFLAGCGSATPPITGCEAGSGITPDCRFQNPEDLVATPGGGALLVSQMGQMDGSRSGNLVLFEHGTGPGGLIRPLFPLEALSDDRSWGDVRCPPPDTALFSPHGLDLVRRDDGNWMLLVVNHGGRESVEMFQVEGEGATLSLRWRGCAQGPDQAFFNDVAGRRDGGFYVTHMYPIDSEVSAVLRGALFGSDIGRVYSWDQQSGWTAVPGSDGPFPNGIALAQDEQALYINMYLSGEVRKLDLASGTVVATYEGGQTDNSTWHSDGRLIVATHIAELSDMTGCAELEAGSCGFAFRIVALDPADLSAEVLLEHEGPPMGAATVALVHDGELFLGTFAGDRIARLPLRSAQ